jgi:hypothetical protein
MRIPVFARGSNPAIDPPIQRKSESYCQAEVEAGRADWVNPDEHSQGISCRAFLYSGQTLEPAGPEILQKLTLRNALPPLEVSGTQFDDPITNLETLQDRRCLVVRARAFARSFDPEVFASA